MSPAAERDARRKQQLREAQQRYYRTREQKRQLPVSEFELQHQRGQRTQPGGEQHGHRNRVCNSNLPHRVCPIQAAANGGNQGLVVFNRDRSGGTNMGMRGVCAVCGVEDIIPGYPWMGPEGDGDE
ncbi:hypothetical protein JKP88DRAFT_245403 [Tribonema minus]|uniref:Uncharacterized protein n=1 Tax=Tribonema minus TaxID=303371 RepID=A0A835YWP0_9STRA|nr:hypothetical protein JKP88DRAFT_245403 [Tribonema minus]